jgi:ABC-type uncharacterized transport system permease subunit
MNQSLLLNLSALGALLPMSIVAVRRPGRRDGMFWAVLAVAIAGPAAFAVTELTAGRLTSLSTALWVTIAASILLFGALCLAVREAWRLTPLLAPYLLLLGVMGSATEFAPGRALPPALPQAWLDIHIVVSVATYGLLTVAAIAGVAVLLQERMLRRKRPSGLAQSLPSVADAERLQVGLLVASEIVLGFGLLTGMATAYMASGVVLPIDHKTVFALLAFVTIGALLLVHHRTGLRGQRAARWVLVAYLLLMLAIFGVKFVTDVLMA